MLLRRLHGGLEDLSELRLEVGQRLLHVLLVSSQEIERRDRLVVEVQMSLQES